MKLKSAAMAFVLVALFLFTTFNSENVLALPQYCNYNQSTHKCCGGGVINCTDVDPDNPFNNKFCIGGVIVPSVSACPY